jgi:hypothetical protein
VPEALGKALKTLGKGFGEALHPLTENFGNTSSAREGFEILQIKLSTRWLTSTHNSTARWPAINNTQY